MSVKLTPVQEYKLRESYEKAHSVLRELKQEDLRGARLKFMKRLEDAVSILEAIMQ